MNYSINIYLLLLFVTTFTYTTKLFLSPAYYLPLIFSAIFIIKHPFIEKKFAKCLLFGLLVCSLLIWGNDLHPAMVHTVTTLFSMQAFPSISNTVKYKSLEKTLSLGCKILLVYYTVELFVRVLYPYPFLPDLNEFEYHLSNEETWFYVYKYGSFAFVDSNLVAVLLLILQLITVELYKKRHIGVFWISLNICLVVLTFSRAAWLGQLVLLLVLFERRIQNLLLFFLILMIMYWLGTVTDASLDSKFYLYQLLEDKLNDAGVYQILFGRSFGYFVEFYGIAAHSIVIQSIIEGGVLYTMLFFLVMKISKSFEDSESFIKFLTVLIPSLSVSIYVICLAWPLSSFLSYLIKSSHEDKC